MMRERAEAIEDGPVVFPARMLLAALAALLSLLLLILKDTDGFLQS